MNRPLLVLLVLGAASCERPAVRRVPQHESVAVSRDTSARPTPGAVPLPVATSPLLETPPTIRDACDAFARIFTASAAANGMPTVDIGTRRDTTMSFGEMQPERLEPACRVAWNNDVSRGAPLGDVYDRAKAVGWAERDHLLAADGPDGSVLAFSRGGIACLVSGSWDGDDDSDSTYVPAPGFEIAASCFANRPDQY